MKVSFLTPSRAARAVALLAAILVCAFPGPAAASSHREAPGISKYPLWDNTDVYAFRDPIVTDQLTVLCNWIPLEDPSGFPNFFHFDENAWYQIHIDNDGDGIEDITYRFVFTEGQTRNPNSFLNFLGPVTASRCDRQPGDFKGSPGPGSGLDSRGRHSRSECLRPKVRNSNSL